MIDGQNNNLIKEFVPAALPATGTSYHFPEVSKSCSAFQTSGKGESANG